MTTALQTTTRLEVSTPLGVQDILAQVRLIQEVMQAVMRDGEHFGKIPGCGDKPTLLQPGAQKLLMTFRLAPEYEVNERELERGHREYRVTCTLKSIQSQNVVGQGVGCCSTMEGKFRYRVAPKKLTDRPVPKEYWDTWKTDAPKAQTLLGGKGFGKAKNDDGQWVISEGSNEKVEHDNPADYYNTVLKMAKKRALVDATITATAASDIFTQDIEDMPEVIPTVTKAPETNQRASEQPTASKSPAQAKPAATTADIAPKSATAETLRWFLSRITETTLDKEFHAYAVEKGILLETESLEDYPLTKVPTSKQAFAALLHEVEEYGMAKSELAPINQDAPHHNSEWYQFPFPFGAHAGEQLGKVDKNYLYGHWANYEVTTEYNGKPKKPETIAKDTKFREMLDAAGTHYGFQKSN